MPAASFALRALAHAIDQADELLLALRGGADDHEKALGVRFEPGLHVDAINPEVDITLGREIALGPAGMLADQASFSRAMLEADSPPASWPSNAASASSKSPVEMPLRYRIGIRTSRLFERRA